MKRIALIGCGAIGCEIAKFIDSAKIDAKLTIIFDLNYNTMNHLYTLLNSKPKMVKSVDEINEIDLVIEAASQDALREYAIKILEKYDLMAMSIGALLDERLFNKIYETTLKYNTRLYLPTGAIAGIDAIKSVRALIDEIEIISTKHPNALKDALYVKMNNLDLTINKPKLIYEGYAKEAVRYFPANINVAATLSLVGVGASNTKVKIIADPNIHTNRHEIFVKGKFGEFMFRVDNIPSPANPKTSYLAILSAIECLRSICDDRIRIGT